MQREPTHPGSGDFLGDWKYMGFNWAIFDFDASWDGSIYRWLFPITEYIDCYALEEIMSRILKASFLVLQTEMTKKVRRLGF